jgi:four helix bundle protein
LYKFEKLEVWQISLDYCDLIYAVCEKLPESEKFNLCSQIIRASTSISLNVAEGSTGQSDAEQARFLGMSIRSLIETVACLRLISRRGYVPGEELIKVHTLGEKLFAKLDFRVKSRLTKKL